METVRQTSLVWSVKDMLYLGSKQGFQFLPAADSAAHKDRLHFSKHWRRSLRLLAAGVQGTFVINLPNARLAGGTRLLQCCCHWFSAPSCLERLKWP